MFFASFVVVVGVVVISRRLAILCICGPEILCVCSPSSFLRVGMFITIERSGIVHCASKKASFIAEIVCSFLNIVNISRLCNLFNCL